MKKLLLLLLIIPFLVFSQNSEKNSPFPRCPDTKSVLTKSINLTFSIDDVLDIEENIRPGELHLHGGTKNGKLFTGTTRYSRKELDEFHNAFTTGIWWMKFDFDLKSFKSLNAQVLFYLWKHDPNGSFQKTRREMDDVDYVKWNFWDKGNRLYDIYVLDNGYKILTEYHIYKSAENTKSPNIGSGCISDKKSTSIYLPNNNLWYHQEYFIHRQSFVDSVLKNMDGWSASEVLRQKNQEHWVKEKKLFHENGQLFLNADYIKVPYNEGNLLRKNEYFVKLNNLVVFDDSENLYPIEDRNTSAKWSCVDDRTTTITNITLDYLPDLRQVDTYHLFLFYEQFKQDCNNSDIILSEISSDKVNITFGELEDNELAKAYGMNQDDMILIKVDTRNWENASIEKKWYIMYHELGHDIFNLDHGQCGKMMFPFAKKEYDWYDFLIDRQEMFNYIKSTIEPTEYMRYTVGDSVYLVSEKKMGKFLNNYPTAIQDKEAGKVLRWHIPKK